MRAILCNAFKGIEALGFTEVDEPRPAANEVLVDVHAASVSYMDYLMSWGGYQMRPALPYVPGTDAAGIVLACGERITRFRPGDRVSCGNWFGAFAERMVAKESSVALLPRNVDFTVGSTIMHTYLTAWYALIERARLQAGETVLVTGAAGGVGLACVEIAHLIGARVIAVVGSAAKAAMARAHGAAEVVDHSCEDVRDRVTVLAGDKGLDVCADNVGGALFATLARLMRLEWPATSNRLHQRRDSVARHESAPAQELFGRRRLRRRLDGALSERSCPRDGGHHGMGRRGQAPPAG
jgi:NADPH:quinone reductase